MKHRFKSIDSAVKRVRRLEALLSWYEDEAQRLNEERKLMARLASETPQFSNPFEVAKAKDIRDGILRLTVISSKKEQVSK